MPSATILLPNQLFADHPGLAKPSDNVLLFEDPLFFGDAQYPTRMHKQKLWLHRASMTRYHQNLVARGINAEIYRYEKRTDACLRMFQKLAKDKVDHAVIVDPVDYIAQQRLNRAANDVGIALEICPSPGFLNTPAENTDWVNSRKRWLMADFYKSQRRRLAILMDGEQPIADQWSFDADNRKRVPKTLLNELPVIDWPAPDAIDQSAKISVLAEFPTALGALEKLYYPTSHLSAAAWLQQFLERRFDRFGDFEDAIVEGESWLWHAVLTPILNIGLLTPKQVLETTLAFAQIRNVPLNSVEGFVRQIIGWREFMRVTYENLGVNMRNSNHWNHRHMLPTSFYNATTGIDPVDETITRILQTGYCHHIERLMVLGGFMFLCEIDPNEVYRWFMEMFVDSYDWVMVPNVYAMSQHADGGLITTKPYFSGSNYIRKMSHWGKGPWADVWDGLYWRFIFKHQDDLVRNPRWSMMCRAAKRMEPERKAKHLSNAEDFLDQQIRTDYQHLRDSPKS